MTTLTLSKQPGRVLECKTRPVTRTMVAATPIARLPQGSRIVALVLSGTASNAVTTATVSFGTTAAATELVSGFDVKTSATGNGVNVLNGVAGAVGLNLANTLGGETIIYAKYAETGGASSTGGWVLNILYTTGEFAR